MANSAVNDSPDAHKRRSSRIVQAVPLTVAGVDALGRPFQERTSTLIINCHGCRYQSKHYVLKNMWLTLEVPHPESGRAPRSVRARVMWIRRPHTVRELFQVGVELEVPGNLWGIAFPPPDWFAFPESLSMESELPVAELPRLPQAEPEEKQPPLQETPTQPESNVRTIPLSGAGDSSLALARQMTRLVNEARQQLQSAIRESASLAVSEEARPLITALHAQIQDAAKYSAEMAVEQAVQGALEQTVQASEAQLQQTREHWNRQIAESVEEASRTLHARIVEVEQSRRAGFTQDLEAESARAVENIRRVTEEFQARLAAAQERLDKVTQRAESSAAPAMEEIQQLLRTHSDEARSQFSELERNARQLHEQMSVAAGAAQADWHARLEADLQAAGNRWNERIETSLEDAMRQAADRLTRRTQETSEQIERETSFRVTAMSKALTDASAEAEQKLAALRGTFDTQALRTQAILAQIEEAAHEVEEHTEQFEALRRAALQEMERRGNALLDVQTQELSRRAESALANWTEGLQPTLEAAGRQIVVRLGAELEKEFGAHFDRAGRALEQLEGGTRTAEEALRRHQDAVAKVSDQSVQSTLNHLQDAIGRLEHGFDESSRMAAAKWLAEIEAKATETTHTTFESLFKTADWYEKKVHTQMQTTLDKGLVQANDSLREKAGEISRLFAAEMDHYSRSYVEHTNGQIEEAAREAVEGARRQSAEMSAASSSAIAQQTRNQTQAALGQFRDQATAALTQLSSEFDSLNKEARATFDADTLKSQEGFRASLLQDAQLAAGSARRDMAAQTESAKQDVRAEAERYAAQMQQTLNLLGEQAIESYRKRLESASNTWLLTTVSKLNQQSTEQLDVMAKSAEIRLRETCNQVFANVGESLRRRLLDFSAQPAAAEPTPNKVNWPPDQK